ncbi:MAG: RNA 2',3'-cyclic phosphodiesterase [Pontibacterium sp.]
MNIRAFFALTLPDSVVRWLADHADTLCEYDKQVEVNWVDSESYHLTLSFLGDISLEQVEQVEQVARARLRDITSFQVHINSTAHYRVSQALALVAALPHACEEIMDMHHLMVQVAEEAGIAHEDAGFKPHITLGRLPGQSNGFEPPEQWPGVDLISLADSVVLFQSKPGERGSVYTPLFEIPLRDLS